MDHFYDENRGERSEAKVAFNKIIEADKEFTKFRRSLDWPEPHEWEDKAGETVGKYIELIRENRGKFTEEALLSYEIDFSDVDPAFAVILRATMGSDAVTAPVWQKLRDSWCNSDLPPKVGELVRIRDDESFIREFEGVDLNSFSNIKLLALQRKGIRSVVEESRQQ